MDCSRRLASFLRPYWFFALLAPLCMALEVAGDLMQPRLMQTIIDHGIARNDMGTVVQSCAWMITLSVAGLFTGSGCGYFAVLAAQGFGADLRGAVFRKVQSLSFGNLDALETGGLITRLTSDITQVQELVMILLRIMVRAPLMLVGSLVMGILTSPRLAVLFLILVPLVLVALGLIIRKTYPIYQRVQQRLDALNTVLQENLAGVRVVKAFVRENFERGRFGAANDNLMQQNIAAVRVSTLTMPVMMLAMNGGVVAAVWIGGINVGKGELQVGQVIAFINYLMQTLFSLMMVSMLVVQVSRAEASAQRVHEVLDAVPSIESPTKPQTLPAAEGKIRFSNVTFSYEGSDSDPVLKDISFEAEPGQTVALLGATGSGKSTLVQLIPRFYDATQGQITFDGIDVRELDEAVLHRLVGVALQESILFSGTIRDNIRYGNPDASEDEILWAAKSAQADEFIQRLPDGYDAVVGQRGVNLSGGQKQRLAIARALLTKPRVLILDDSTSAVDTRTEAAIQDAIASQDFIQTRFLVAQRISSVLNADKILVLDDGAIVASGTHEELLASSPIYQEIYASQMENGVMNHGGE